MTRDSERLERTSVLQELTVAALELFDPQRPVDLYLERVAERLGCTAALWLVWSEGTVSLLGSSGLSRLSCASPLIAETPASAPAPADWGAVRLPYPELAHPSMVRWAFDLGCAPGASTHHGLVLCFEGSARLPPQFRPMVERLAHVLRTAVAHRHVLESLHHAQEALLQRERLAALGALAAVVAHEVRNPLGAIFNCLRSLELDGVSDGPALLKIVKEEAGQIDRIVGNLLDFAKPRGLSLALQPLEPIVAGGIEAAQRAQVWPIVVEFEVGPKVSPSMVDADLLRQAVINLVTNALQAVSSEGRVMVRLTEELSPTGRTFTRIDVKDDGGGIAALAQHQVFQPFFTTRASGTGLGLSIVKRIVEDHGGELSLTSEPRQGTTFTVRLPLEPR